jgi:hypothetical protein
MVARMRLHVTLYVHCPSFLGFALFFEGGERLFMFDFSLLPGISFVYLFDSLISIFEGKWVTILV